MLGFVVTSASGRTTIEATHYDVLDDGELVVCVGPKVARRFDPADWFTVEPVGTRLAPSWPPMSLEPLLDSVRGFLAAHGYYVHEVRTGSDFASPLLNEAESLVEALLAAVGVDSSASSNSAVADGVRDLVVRHFQPVGQ
ncbi:MAG TPA: hypothetical protein VFZ77_16225 [Acidimicrobiales bacterium]